MYYIQQVKFKTEEKAEVQVKAELIGEAGTPSG